MALTPAMEDYLEAILMIKQQHGYVRIFSQTGSEDVAG